MFKSVAYIFGSQISNIALGVISGAIINRALGPNGRGDYGAILSWISIFVSVCGLSATSAIYHHANPSEHDYSRAELLGSVMAVWVITILVAALLVPALEHLVPRYFTDTFRHHTLLAIVVVASGLALGISSALCAIVHAFRALSIVYVLGQIATLAGLLVLKLHHLLTIPNLLLLSASVQLGEVVVVGQYLRKSRPGFFPVRMRLDLIRDLLWSGLKLHLGSVSVLLYVKIDQVILNGLAGNVETGYYSVAVAIAMQTMVLPSAIRDVLYSHVLDVGVGEDATLSIQVTKLAIFGFGLSLVGIYILAPFIIQVFAGIKFVPSIRLLRALLPAVWLFAIPNLLSPLIVKRGYFSLASGVAISVFVVNMAANLLWIPGYKSMGAVLATNVTYLYAAAVGMAMFYFISGVNPLRLAVVTRADLGIVWKRLSGGWIRIAPTFMRPRTAGDGTT